MYTCFPNRPFFNRSQTAPGFSKVNRPLIPNVGFRGWVQRPRVHLHVNLHLPVAWSGQYCRYVAAVAAGEKYNGKGERRDQELHDQVHGCALGQAELHDHQGVQFVTYPALCTELFGPQETVGR